MEENMERKENELQAEVENEAKTESAPKKTESSETPSSPKKPPMDKKTLIAIIGGAAVALVAVIIALVLILGGKDGHTCSFGEWTVVADATCTEAGSKERVCSCGEKQTESIAAKGHDWKEASCQSPKTCKVCNATEGSAAAHAYTEKVTSADALKSAASCTSPAVYYKSCVCGKVSTDANDTFTNGSTAAHSYTLESSTEADCENAATETYACACGDRYTNTISEALGHDIKGSEYVETPVDGSSCEFVWVYTCEECGEDVEGEHVYYHSYIAAITTSPTCKDDGVKTLTCTCGDVQTEKIEKNSTGHKWIKGEAVDGVRTDSCEYCSETKKVTVFEGTTTDAIKPDDLKDTEIELNDANISLDEGVVDSIGDNDVTISAEKLTNDDLNGLLDPDQLDQVGNSPIYNFTINDGSSNISSFGENNYVTITLPYTLQEGDDVDSIAIWFIADDGQLESIKATYNNGYVTFKTNHFSYYTVTRLTPAERCELYGHNFAEQTFKGSCTQDGYILKVCVRCHKSEKTITSVAQGHVMDTKVTEPTCTTNGITVHSCKNCSLSYTTTQVATGHSYESVKKEESTCSKNGYETFKCTKCNDEYTETLPKLDHQMVNEQIVKEATCVESGLKLITCVCGESVQVEIPATNNHIYSNGVCTQCGQSSGTAVKIDGIVIRVNNFSFSMSEKEDEDSDWELIGKIEKVDLTELMVYVEDGELHGAAIGSVDYFDQREGASRTYALTAIIDGGFIYYNIEYGKQNINGKYSLEEVISDAIELDDDVSSQITSFAKDTLIPAIETLVDKNAEAIDEIVNDALNILFTTETKADGTRVISLDHDKIEALNENLATLSVAEVIDYYFGEGTVDKLYDTVIDTLNTKITEIPDIISENGIDLDKLLDECKDLCDMLGLPISIEDIKEVLYGEDYAEITIGMLIFGSEDNSYVEDVDAVVDMLSEKTLYELIAPEHADDVKEMVDQALELISGKIDLEFTVNPAGQLIDIGVDVLDLTLEIGDRSAHIDASVDISFTGRIDVTWADIVNEINSGMVAPKDDMYETKPYDEQHNMSGQMQYKGSTYYYHGQYLCSFIPNYDNILGFTSESDCGDFRAYEYTYSTIGYAVSVRQLVSDYNYTSDEILYTLVVNESTDEIVELEMKENGATAIYSDGTTKELTADDFASLQSVYKAIFGSENEKLSRTDYLYFHYNAKTGEYAKDSQHEYEAKHELKGDSCEDGVVTTYTCKNCGDSYTRTYRYHECNYEEIDLTDFGACYGTARFGSCACGKEFGYHFDCCGNYNYNDNEYYDEEGRYVRTIAYVCLECGLRAQITTTRTDLPGSCEKPETHKVVVSVGNTLVLDKEYTSTETIHDYNVVAVLHPGATSCEDGVDIHYTCKNCGDSYSNTDVRWHQTYTIKKIELSQYGSLCGGYMAIQGCACGYHTSYENHSMCDLNSKYCELWIDDVISGSQFTTNGSYYYHNESYIEVCAVTHPEACPFKIRYASYWLYNGDCTATRYRTWQFGYNEETGSYAYELTVPSETRQYHNYTVTEYDNGARYECPDCGSYYSDMSYFDSYGRQTKSETIAVNTLNVGNKYYEHITEYEYDSMGDRTSYTYRNKTIYQDGRTNERLDEYIYINGYEYDVFSYYNDGSYWYQNECTYDFSNGCNRTRVYTNSYGERDVTTENCCKNYWDTIESPTCSQEGLEGTYCPVCQTRLETYPIEPTDHNWVEIEKGHFYCFGCGLENSNGISGNVILEDLTNQYGNGTHYVVGYYVYDYLQFTYYVSIILDSGEEVILDGISFTEGDKPRAISFSMAEVENALASKGYSYDDGDVRFAFVPYGGDGSFDYAITFTPTVNVDVIVNDVSFVEYVQKGETLSFTICPTESGYWSFTSMANMDSYADLYDQYGDCLASNDDGGYEANFKIEYYLEAGETYTICVRWLSPDNEGRIPLLFTFIG